MDPIRLPLNFGSDSKNGSNSKIFWKKRMPERLLFKRLEKGEERGAETCAGQHSAIPWRPTVWAFPSASLETASLISTIPGTPQLRLRMRRRRRRKAHKKIGLFSDKWKDNGSRNRKKGYQTVKWDRMHDGKRLTLEILCSNATRRTQKESKLQTHTHTQASFQCGTMSSLRISTQWNLFRRSYNFWNLASILPSSLAPPPNAENRYEPIRMD